MTPASDRDARELARQLREPQGDDGIRIGNVMHAGNFRMTQACFASLGLTEGGTLLEIGHGNAAHVPGLLQACPEIRFQGLDVSSLMRDEAARLNHAAVQRGLAVFTQYDGGCFPFSAQQFDAAMSVNTVYFLPQPLAFLEETYRVLRPGAPFSLAFADKAFMRQQAFAQHGFSLFGTDEMVALLEAAQFKVLGVETHQDIMPSAHAHGAGVARLFHVVQAVR
ncbi:class I SAM-dependent methyltransferase [Achromobacter seleniivolatilans]|uniref:Class I SAM-dependent methyltransferase n=1 Tax=Achromobacter seleniivolatilans TaxID=3047478 RepID=A0ABY9M766_9BURK|nr:class I SAM-dependent methyltransferase [Achromobacter sp. R39]WMD22866.1 class I SAM-dependent methyltransferase [Achromobacter sp. R39]